MVRSIRWRLQLWYAVVLLAVVAGFAGILYQRVRSARFREIDADLAASAAYLDTALRAFPPFELEGGDRSRPPPPRRPRHRPAERLLAELRLPGPDPGAPGDERGFIIWRGDGSVLKETWPDQPPERPTDVVRVDRAHVRRRPGVGEVAVRGPHRTVILVRRSTERVEAELNSFAWQLTAAGAAVLVVGLAGGWLAASRIQRPLAAISDTASRISATNLSERIATDQIDSELRELSGVLNATFDRLEQAFARQTQFTADASHELRTPLAVVRSQADLALLRPRTAEEYREALEHCRRAAVRMSAIVEGLLVLARADAGRLEQRRGPVALDRVVADAVGLIEPLARDRGVTIETELVPCVVHGDAEALARIAGTLLDNAVRYNRPGGRAHVAVRQDNGEVVLSVADTGVGIPAEARPHVFDRFYRVDPARSRASGGTGLGLAICKSMAEAHGGRVEVESEVAVGSTFRVRLPAGEGALPAAVGRR